MNGEAGKGDLRRPALITAEEEAEAWERAIPGSTRLRMKLWCTRHDIIHQGGCPQCQQESQ